jgi:hypothetical protein
MTLSEDLVLFDDYIVISFTSQRHPAKFIAAADLKERGEMWKAVCIQDNIIM